MCAGVDVLEVAKQLGRYVVYLRAASAVPRGGICVALPLRRAEAR
jgi:hypothetical protein